MKLKSAKTRFSTLNHTATLLVLAGFLCVQLHSFTHIHDHDHNHDHEHSYEINHDLCDHDDDLLHFQKTEKADRENHNDCIACVLTKQMQVDVEMDSGLFFDHFSGILPIVDTVVRAESHLFYFSLRAPPLHTV